MTSEQFTYWLQGYFELSGAKTISEEQVKIIKDHLSLVLKKVMPNTVTIVGGQGIGYDPKPIYIPTVQSVPTVSPPLDYTTCTTCDNASAGLNSETTLC